MARSGTSNYAGLRTALVLGSVAASVVGARLVTERDLAAQAAQANDEPEEEPTLEPTLIPTSTPMPTPTPQVIIIYDLPAVPTAIVPGGGQPLPPGPQVQVQAAPQLPPPVVVDAGGGGGGGGNGGGGGGGGGNKPAKPKKSKSSK